MKTLIKLLCIFTLLFTTQLTAHEGHGKVDKNQIVQAAQKSAKILTFKDKGMAVGKLDKSWNRVPKEHFKVIEENHDAIIVKATNMQNKQTLYFTVSKGGKVKDVKDVKAFEHAHGHSH